MKNSVFRIALLGPESAGKTTLANELAQAFHTVWVPEFSRNYIENLDRSYTKEDILFTITEQCKIENELLKEAKQFLFADTDPIIAKVWMQDVFKESSAEIEKLIQDKPYDFYLLLSPDLPFVSDPVRENEERRDFFFEWYKKELDSRKFPYAIISGNGNDRFQNAKNAIENFTRAQRKT